MKRLLFISSILIILTSFSSCTSNSNGLQAPKQTDKTTLGVKTDDGIFAFKFGHLESGKIILDVPKSVIVDLYSNFVEKYYNSKFELDHFEIERINNHHYLRFYNDDRSVVSLGIFKGDDDVHTGQITCRTNDCAHSDGCVPEGKHCTECKIGKQHNIPGDCEKKTTGKMENKKDNLKQC